MEFEKIAQFLIYIHAGFGGIALVSGGVSLIAKKGNSLHKQAGKLFFYTMLASTSLSLVIALTPNHKSSFLFFIGLFSSYFIIGGYRSLAYKNKDISLASDKKMAYSIIIIGIAMLLYPIIKNGKIDIVLLTFGLVSILFGLVDLLVFNNKKRVKKNWLKIHLSKMISGYVATVTAFVVVNQWIPGVWAWFTPAIFGNVYLTYWLIKLKK